MIFKVGDKVKLGGIEGECLRISGPDVIDGKINGTVKAPLYVHFKNGELGWFTPDGKTHDDKWDTDYSLTLVECGEGNHEIDTDEPPLWGHFVCKRCKKTFSIGTRTKDKTEQEAEKKRTYSSAPDTRLVAPEEFKLQRRPFKEQLVYNEGVKAIVDNVLSLIKKGYSLETTESSFKIQLEVIESRISILKELIETESKIKETIEELGKDCLLKVEPAQPMNNRERLNQILNGMNNGEIESIVTTLSDIKELKERRNQVDKLLDDRLALENRNRELRGEPKKKLNEAIELINAEIKKEYAQYERTREACSIVAEFPTIETMKKSADLQSSVRLNYAKIDGLETAIKILKGLEASNLDARPI